MRVVLLGTTGYHPNDSRQTACVMLPEAGIVLDAGTGMYRVREYLVTSELDILVSHAHLDHIVGLTYLLDVKQGKELGRISVHAAQKHLSAIRDHLFSEPLFPVAPPFEFAPLPTGSFVLTGGVQVTHFALTHPGGSTGFRLDWPDRSLAYVTDTVATPDASYLNEIRGVDLLIHECYFPDERSEWATKTGHSATSAVARLARQADVGRLVLVHIDPQSEAADPIGLETAQVIFAATEIGCDRMELEF